MIDETKLSLYVHILQGFYWLLSSSWLDIKWINTQKSNLSYICSWHMLNLSISVPNGSVALFRIIFWRNKIYLGKTSPIFPVNKNTIKRIAKYIRIIYNSFKTFLYANIPAESYAPISITVLLYFCGIHILVFIESKEKKIFLNFLDLHPGKDLYWVGIYTELLRRYLSFWILTSSVTRARTPTSCVYMCDQLL